MTRFQLMLPEPQRAGLSELADKTGLSSADLVRLAIGRLLEARELSLPAAEQPSGQGRQ
jgi:hypothetical protein